MGSDKAFVEFAGSPLVAQPMRALNMAEQLVAIGGDRAALESLGVSYHPDATESAGPAMAIVDGARQLGDAALPTTVVLACDLPLIDAATVTRLVDIRVRTGADLVVALNQGRPQWLASAWRHQSLMTRRAQPSMSIRALLHDLSVCYVVDPSLSVTTLDADNPKDLAALRSNVTPVHEVLSR